MEAGVTGINGPVSFYLLKSPKGRATFYLFGDAHFSKSLGCPDTDKISMLPNGSELTKGSVLTRTATSVDFDAAVYLLLRYGNTMKIKTHAFVELPASEELSGESIGWMYNISELTRHKTTFAPNSRILGTDVRTAGKNSYDDIFTTIQFQTTRLLKKAELGYINDGKFQLELKAVVDISRVVLESTVAILDALTKTGKMDSLKELSRKVSRFPQSLVKKECLEGIDSMIQAEDFILVDGKPTVCHKIAATIHKLASNRNTSDIARKNADYFAERTAELVEEIHKADTLSAIASGVAAFSDSDDVVNQVTFSHLRLLRETMKQLGSHIMDIYTIASAFLSEAPRKIIVTGQLHTNTYYELLTKVHGYTPLVAQSNSYEIDEGDGELRTYVSRCLRLDDLSQHVDFAAMKDAVYKNL